MCHSVVCPWAKHLSLWLVLGSTQPNNCWLGHKASKQTKSLTWYVWKFIETDIKTINIKNNLKTLGPTYMYSKTCVKQPLSKRPKIGFQDQLSLIAGQKYCRMLQGEHSAILLTFIKLPVFIKTFVLSTFDWPFCIGFTVFGVVHF